MPAMFNFAPENKLIKRITNSNNRMKKVFTLTLATIAMVASISAQTITGVEAEKMISGAALIRINAATNTAKYVQFKKGAEVDFASFDTWMHRAMKLNSSITFHLINTEHDQLGMVHYRYQQAVNDLLVDGTMIIAHTKSNKMTSVTIDMVGSIGGMQTIVNVSETEAFQAALRHVHAKKYRWQDAASENQIKEATGNENATYFPTAELMIAAVNGENITGNYRAAYRFDIYASEPWQRTYVFVDAATGAVIAEQNRIHDVNRNATAHTQYSGIRTMITDSLAGHYRLQETGRGLGIKTYNNQTNNNPQNVDFINATTDWNQVNANLDQYATDAHYGAEKTYDFYDSTFNRNSIDDAGLALLSYVHVEVNLVNAFWDGSVMSYGDGDGATYNPLTSMEITGHEITHGFTQYTANFAGGGEPGAMNEAMSDCFGVSVRRMGQQATLVDWSVGDQIGGGTFRDMAVPANTSNPVCYQGVNWDFANQEVHQNSTPFSHCYYLVTMGGSGTNEFSETYNITGIGLLKAEKIWYRMQAVYNTTNSQYIDARDNCVQAAVDLFGGCSPEVVAVTNAWYAVHVGAAFVVTPPVANFTALSTTYCSVPSSVPFINTTTNGGNYRWSFGDGDTSSLQNPVHQYNAPGVYTVKLVTNGTCGVDSITQISFIDIHPPVAPVSTSPITINCNASAILYAFGSDTMKWYNQATGGNPIAVGGTYTTPNLTANTTYYVESEITGPHDFDTPDDNTIGAGGYFTNSTDRYNIFDVLNPCTLVSVLVYGQSAGSTVIELRNSAGTPINSMTVNIPDGPSRVYLYFPLTVGTNYQLGVNGTTNLYRSTAGINYPYNDAAGYVSITTSNAAPTVRYYYFYNWELGTDTCISVRTPVNVVINGPVASFTQSQVGNTVTFTNTSTGSTSWLWNFGDNTTSAQTNPTHTYTNDGTYTVTLYAYNGACVDSFTQTLVIFTTGLNPTDANAFLSIFPNPVADELGINLNAKDSGKEWSVKMIDMIGRTVATATITSVAGNKQIILHLDGIAAGIYTLELQNNGTKLIRKIVKE